MTEKAGGGGMFYAKAVMSGVQTVNLMFGGETAETTAAYNNAYANESKRYALNDALSAAQSNLQAIKQNKLLSNVKIDMEQNKVEAQLKVQAAAAGAEGSSVNQAIYQTEANAAYASGRMNAQAQQAEEAVLAAIHTNRMDMLSIQDQEIDYFGNAVGALAGSVNNQDLMNLGTYIEEKNWFNSEPSDQELEDEAMKYVGTT